MLAWAGALGVGTLDDMERARRQRQSLQLRVRDEFATFCITRRVVAGMRGRQRALLLLSSEARGCLEG